MNGSRRVAEARTHALFEDIDRAALPLAGGKAANLGELIRAGLPVPDGFCVTTAAYDLVAGDAGLDSTLAALAETRPDDTARLAELAQRHAPALLEAHVPDAPGRGYRYGVSGVG